MTYSEGTIDMYYIKGIGYIFLKGVIIYYRAN